MNENKQISSRARKLLPSAVWANVRWKRDGYYRTSPNQNRRWLVVAFRIRPISLGKSRRFYVHRPAPFRGFATRTKKKKKKKKKKKADLRRERGGSSEPPEPPLRTGLHVLASLQSCLNICINQSSEYRLIFSECDMGRGAHG